MKVAVTGGLGFIGSNFIDYVLKEHNDWQIINVDKETYASNRAYLSQYNNDSRYELITGDISIKSQIEEHLTDVDIIVNFAAESHVDNSIKGSNAFIMSNYVGVKNLLEIATERGIRIHQVSTDEVFGSLPLNSKKKFNEKTRYDPRNPYSATKAAADHLAMAFLNTFGTKVTISYSGNNYGPHQHPEKLIPKTILNLALGKKIPLYGTGFQIRDWVYVEDHCRAIDLILNKGKIGDKFIISSGNLMKNLDMVLKITRLMHKSKGMIEFVRDRPGHDLKYASSAIYIKKSLGWYPRVNLQNGLIKTIEHYNNNLDWYLGMIV